MSEKKELRWRQRFENFHKSYTLLDQYIQKPIETELERAGIVQFFETTFELSWKLMKDYLEAQGTIARSPREAIKLSFQCGLIDDGYVWIDALSSRNQTVHLYDEKVVAKLIIDIAQVYHPAFKKLYEKLIKEL